MGYNKYHARKIRADGMTFDSRKEFNRWRELQILEASGRIDNLRRQVAFELIPEQRELDILGPRGGRKPGKIIERPCKYVADFVYRQNGKTVVEDCKGVRTSDYKIKRKLMLWRYNIKILET
jgi:hypothetical protein